MGSDVLGIDARRHNCSRCGATNSAINFPAIDGCWSLRSCLILCWTRR